MGTLAYRLREPDAAIAAAGLLSALLVGVGLAADLPVGLALLVGLCYAAIALSNLQLGLALWVPLAFMEGIPLLNLAGKAAGLLVVVAWLGSFQSIRRTVAATLSRHRRLVATLAGLLAWSSLSLAWSADLALGLEDIWHWYLLAVLFVVVATTVTTPRALRLVLAAFVAGAVVSVVVGLADGSLTSAVDGGARLSGTAGDPNFLASSLVAATVLAAGLLADARSPLVRFLLVAAMAVLITGLVASGSRGGLLAAAATIVAAFVLFKRRRVHVAAIVAVGAGIAALAFINVPGTWERVTNFDDDNGRSDLWTVAWRMGDDHPVAGVGVNNYRARSADYVREPGALENVNLIVDDPHLVHNTYLELFAETGVVGLALFVGFVLACLRATKLAADRFEARQERALGALAQAVLVATISMLAAAVFLSGATDKRLWLLLALGPALLTVAGRAAAASTTRAGPEAAPPPAPRAPPRGARTLAGA
jgi:O-antigen ligase